MTRLISLLLIISFTWANIAQAFFVDDYHDKDHVIKEISDRSLKNLWRSLHVVSEHEKSDERRINDDVLTVGFTDTGFITPPFVKTIKQQKLRSNSYHSLIV
jgi:hypothetical protein